MCEEEYDYEMTERRRGGGVVRRVLFKDPGECPECGETVTPKEGKRGYFWRCEKCSYWRRAQPGEIVVAEGSTGTQEAQGSGEKVPGKR